MILIPPLQAFTPLCGESVCYAESRVPISKVLHSVEGLCASQLQEGLIDELVEEGQALAAAMDYAKKLARGPSVAIDLARHFIYRSLNSTLEDTLRYEGVAAVMSAMTDDAREGTAAFLEKRRPNYRGV